jgi:hypothetical protein
VIQDTRNGARQDSEIEATNTEARIRSEVQLGELRDGQAEIKATLRAHDSATTKIVPRK